MDRFFVYKVKFFFIYRVVSFLPHSSAFSHSSGRSVIALVPPRASKHLHFRAIAVGAMLRGGMKRKQ